MKNLQPLHLILGGCGLTVLSNFLPWASAKVTMGGRTLMETSVNGWNRDGAIIFGLVVAAGVLTMIKKPEKAKMFSLIALICTGLALLIAIYDLISATSSFSEVKTMGPGAGVEADASIGFGLYLAVLASGVAAWGCFQRWKTTPADPAVSPPPATPPPVPPQS